MISTQRFLIEEHLKSAESYFRGTLLNAGCGDMTYEKFYLHKIEKQVRLDWPNTLHKKLHIDVFGSVMQLPFADQRFDIVLCTEVLEHIPNPEKALLEFQRVLKHGGTLFLTVPFLYQLHETPYDFYRYTYYGLKYLIESNGFEIKEFKARGEIIAVVIYFFRKLGNRIAKKLLGRRLAGLIPWMVLDTMYRMIFRKHAELGAEKTEYTLGYTVIAKKKVS